MTIELAVFLAVIGTLVGVAGWVRGRDNDKSKDAEWKGGVNAKLDVIVGISREVDGLQKGYQNHEGRLCAVENSTKSAHHRMDEHILKEGKV